MKPVAIGVGAGVLLFLLPEGIGPVVVVAAALLAGWVLPNEPMKAAALFLAPAAVLGTVRVLLDEGANAIGALAFGLVITVLFVAIFTHVGAGIALRRQG